MQKLSVLSLLTVIAIAISGCATETADVQDEQSDEATKVEDSEGASKEGSTDDVRVKVDANGVQPAMAPTDAASGLHVGRRQHW